MKTVCFAPANIDACGLWRFFFPHLHLPGSRFLFTGGTPPFNEICETDIVCCQRMMSVENARFLQGMRALGMRIIYDLDDNVWTIPPDNPASHIFKMREIQQGMMACAEWADVLTVSTPTLKKVMERNWGHLRNAASKKEIPVVVCQNRVDPLFYRPSDKDNGDKIVIGWGGSNTHAGDLAGMWTTLHKILDDYPNVEVKLVGQQAPFVHTRLSYHEWVHIAEFPFYLRQWNWDIFLAPLEEHKFNKSKSSIKLQEAGALGRPCLASTEQPYVEFCGSDKDISWQLCSIPFQWENKLRKLIEDKTFRLALGQKMLQHTTTNFHIKQSIAEWNVAIDMCFN